MSKEDIISEYGSKLSREDIDNLDEMWNNIYTPTNTCTVAAVGTGK
jgi:hypothetical protein